MRFLGFVNYNREFIKGYADKVYPMQKLMRNKGKKFEWSDEVQTAFENLKRELCEAGTEDDCILENCTGSYTLSSLILIYNYTYIRNTT